MENGTIKIGDRVKQARREGLRGVVKGVHSETTAKADQKDKSLMIEVLWDNGTLSYLTPDQLQVLETG